MIAEIEKSTLAGEIFAPPSKSMAHRLLLLSALTGGVCKVENLDYSEDVLAMLDCLTALGAICKTEGSSVTVNGENFLKCVLPELNCRESGNTLRFLIPLCLTLGKRVTLRGSKRLMERPQSVYEELCRRFGCEYIRGEGFVTVCGDISGVRRFSVDGSVSSQFITGLIFAMLSMDGDGIIEICPPFESRSYVELTASAVKAFGGEVTFISDYCVAVKGKSLTPRDISVEGDYSNAAFLDAFNLVGGNVKVKSLSHDSVQGDRVYKRYFAELAAGCRTFDITDCPDLGPVIMALGALRGGCVLTGTRRLAMKESDRGVAMRDELAKFGVKIELCENSITVPKTTLSRPTVTLEGHNDHRIVMSLAIMCSVTGGTIEGCEAVSKTYPHFFEDIISLGAKAVLKQRGNSL